MSARDGLYVQLQELQAQLSGISPKLGLYKQIEGQIAALKEQLGGNSIPQPRYREAKEINSLNGTRIKVREVREDRVTGKPSKPKNYALSNLRCSHNTQSTKCAAEGCKVMTRSTGRGKCDGCGKTKYKKHCKAHAQQYR